MTFYCARSLVFITAILSVANAQAQSFHPNKSADFPTSQQTIFTGAIAEELFHALGEKLIKIPVNNEGDVLKKSAHVTCMTVSPGGPAGTQPIPSSSVCVAVTTYATLPLNGSLTEGALNSLMEALPHTTVIPAGGGIAVRTEGLLECQSWNPLQSSTITYECVVLPF